MTSFTPWQRPLTLLLLAAALVAPRGARAQAQDSTTAQAASAPGNTAADTTTGAVAPDSAATRHVSPRFNRASWISDRLPLRVGDLVTVIVDEQTAARERVSQIATGNRNKRAALRAVINNDQNGADITTGVSNDSRDVGEANRLGGLTAVLTVRVTAIEDGGPATIEGSKRIMVDGRAQEITLKGLIRPQDVTPSNTVNSENIAEAVITYKGKKIGPRAGIIGKILELLWP